MRWFGVRYRNLPPHAAIYAEINERWTLADRLLAVNAMQTNAVYRAVLASIPMPKYKRPPLPKPLVIPMPGAKKQRKSWIKEWASKVAGRG